MDLHLQSLSGVLEQADSRLRAGSHAAPRVWPTGFGVLDTYLAGGFRSSDLILLGGPQGLGKTTFALQVVRQVAASGRSVVYFSFEHDTQTVLERLIAIEAGEIAGASAVNLRRIRAALETRTASGTLDERLSETIGGRPALEALHSYGDRLLIHRSSGNSTSLDTIIDVTQDVRAATGQLPLLVVDYLQKMRVHNDMLVEEERVTRIVEGLKDLALDISVPVLAVVASDKEGLVAGKRMRVHNLRGSSALAYEADTVLMMNDKYDVVARHHLVYDIGNAERFRDYAVVTIEKNRNGLDKIDLEFRKRFDQGRFETEGTEVREKLVDERVFVE